MRDRRAEGGADDPPPLRCKEIDDPRIDLFSRANEVSLIFPVFIVDDNDRVPIAQRYDRIFDGIEPHSLCIRSVHNGFLTTLVFSIPAWFPALPRGALR
jgi:hypothetical protein